MGLGIGFVFLIINTFKGKLFSSVWRHRGKRHQEKFKRWKIGHAGKTRPTERNRKIFQEKKDLSAQRGFSFSIGFSLLIFHYLQLFHHVLVLVFCVFVFVFCDCDCVCALCMCV